MPGDAIAVIQVCKVCASEVGTFSEKKENLMLATVDHVWCEACKAVMPAARDIAGRGTSIAREVERPSLRSAKRVRRLRQRFLKGSL